MVAKTLIIIEKKNGSETRINSPEETIKLVAHLSTGELGQAFVFKDIDDSFVMVNTSEFALITFIPLEP